MTIIKVDLETGDLSIFDSTVTDGDDLSAQAGVGRFGAYGLQLEIDDQAELKAYIETDDDTLHPALATGVEFWMREYFKIDSAYAMGSEDNHQLHEINSRTAPANLFDIRLSYDAASDGKYRLSTRYQGDAADWLGGSYTTGPILEKGQWYCLEWHWKRSSADNANDAELDLWIDNALIQHIDSIDIWEGGNGVGSVRIRTKNLDVGTSGKLYFDDLVISDEGRIYPLKRNLLTGCLGGLIR